MKLVLVGLFISLSAIASESILLDAACKTSCIVKRVQVINSQSYSYQTEYANVYTDYKGLTREQVDQKSQRDEMNTVCKAALTDKAVGASNDCLTFKHDS